MKIDMIQIVIGVVIGFFFSLALFWLKRSFIKNVRIEKEKELSDTVEKLKGAFASLSLDALSKNSEEFLRLAQQKFEASVIVGEKDLEAKKALINQSLEGMNLELGKVENLMRSLEKDRENKFAELSTNLGTMSKEVSHLQQTTEHLKNALSNTKVRGDWGERMAEDVLRLAGFVESVNYEKQKTQSVGRPDYTFFLPQGMKVNMDVKFPLDNYLRFFEADTDKDKKDYKLKFLQDVKQRIKEVTSRDYINPEQKTVDYVIVFIPNEQVYAFVNQSDRNILDEAMRQRVIFCSPLTLYAILAVIRQAMDNFNLERTANKILFILRDFKKQYDAFCDTFSDVGEKIEKAKEAFDGLVTTRKNKLDVQLKKIEELRQEKGIALEDETGA